jgi:RNA polymerase sigma-70 factor (ECF subfamily)
MDQLQLARRKREVYVGPWLPEPIHAEAPFNVSDPEERMEMEESISLAFLVLLEQLQPFERAVFLLREVFGYEFAEIADMLGKSDAACRRSFSRAKQHIRERRPRFPASHQTHRQLLESYFQALEAGDMDTMMHLLTEDATVWTDGGGKIKTAALRPIIGRANVARFSLGTQRFLPPGRRIEMGEVNGEPALIVRDGERVFSVISLEVEAARIRTIWVLANPDKLTQV